MKRSLKIAFGAAACITAILPAIIAGFATNLFTVNPVSREFKNIPVISKNQTSEITMQFIRHATLLVIADNKKILIDPMLGDIGTESPFPLTANRVRNPLIALDVEKNSIVNGVDAVILTHCHPDHFDKNAQTLLPKKTIIFCQPADVKFLEHLGFKDVRVIDRTTVFGKISIARFDGNHGRDLLRSPMGRTSSYNITVGKSSLFITGDSIYDELLKTALNAAKPKNIVAFTGAAGFIFGDPITLTADDVYSITQLLPGSKIYAVHMNAINHCRLTKDKLRAYRTLKNIERSILIPDEGQIISFD